MDNLTPLSAKSFEKKEKQQRKKVRFTGDVGGSDEEDDRPQKPLFPKGKKFQPVELDEAEDGNPVLPADPRVVAQVRATKRKDLLDHEDTDLLDDVVGAEEDFEVKDEENDEFEPFNLRKEREEGYFDADGNYVEYRVDKTISDAWLDSTVVDERFAETAALRAAAADEKPEALSMAKIGEAKRRMADILLPGETVLQGLKRLGGTSKKVKGRGKLMEKIDPEKKKLFDQLTEDAMALMDNGEFEVYSEKQETFKREAEGYKALLRVRSTPLKRGSDMFEDSDDDVSDDVRPPAKRHATDGLKSESATESLPGGTTSVADSEAQTTSGQSEVFAEGSGYVYDPSSGYYYNSELGYFYNAENGLYYNSATGIWYKFDESSNSYVEIENVQVSKSPNDE